MLSNKDQQDLEQFYREVQSRMKLVKSQLDLQMSEQSYLLFQTNHRIFKLERVLTDIKRELLGYELGLYDELSKTGKPTERKLQAAKAQNKKMMDLQHDHDLLALRIDLLRGVVKALDHRRDMLINLSAYYRKDKHAG